MDETVVLGYFLTHFCNRKLYFTFSTHACWDIPFQILSLFVLGEGEKHPIPPPYLEVCSAHVLKILQMKTTQVSGRGHFGIIGFSFLTPFCNLKMYFTHFFALLHKLVKKMKISIIYPSKRALVENKTKTSIYWTSSDF